MVPAGRTIDGAGQVVRPRPERFEEFSQRYRAELEDPERAKAMQHLGELAKNRTVTLRTATSASRSAGPWCLLACSGADCGQHVPTPASVAGTARQFGDARAGKRQRCSGDVKPTAGMAVAPRRSRLGHKTVEDVHEAGQPRH
jgi:hypothetical protein